MQAKDRKLLTVLSTVLLAAWFIGDFLLGVAVTDMASDAQRENSVAAREAERQRISASYRSFSGARRQTGPLELASFHQTIQRPLRYAAIAGLLLFVAFGPIAGWVRNLPQHYSQNPRAVVAAILLLASVAMFAGAQFVVSQYTTTSMQTRAVTGAALEEDRRQRTMVNPPGHLNPNVGNSRRPTSITFGADPMETVTVSEVDKSVASYVDMTRIVAAIVGCLGLTYGVLSGFHKPPRPSQLDQSAIGGN